MSGDEVYVDGLPVGNIFSFVWNAMISTFFQLAGFFLTYLLHTTHAAKNGSKAGLGLTLVQYGFYLKSSKDSDDSPGSSWSDNGAASSDGKYPPDPNSYNFNPDTVESAPAAAASSAAAGAGSPDASISSSEAISYILMIVGWFILIRAFSDYLRARRHEQLVMSSPDRALPVPVESV